MKRNYEIQTEKGFSDCSIQVATRFKEAFNIAMEEIARLKSNIAYIWPLTSAARKLISEKYNGDYVKINPSGNIEGGLKQ